MKILMLLLITCLSSLCFGEEVNGYFKKDGEAVRSYVRKDPDSLKINQPGTVETTPTTPMPEISTAPDLSGGYIKQYNQ